MAENNEIQLDGRGKKQQEISMIIFTGTGRSGAGLYSKLFNTHHEYNVPQLIKRHFPPPNEVLISDPFANFSKRLEIMAHPGF